MHFPSFLLPIFFSFLACNNKEKSRIEPVVEQQVHLLGNTPVVINISHYGSSSKNVFVQLHSNEETALQAAATVLEEKGGLLISLQNGEDRNISFSLKGKRYLFDPNRMFTQKGRMASLKIFSTYNLPAAVELKELAEAVVQLIPEYARIIALHNNTNNNYTIKSYLSDPEYKKSGKAVYRNDSLDVDDFFITTDSTLFDRLKNNNCNVVLEQYTSSFDDGSLSVYMAKQNRTYINVEAEYGHLEEQTAMLYQLLTLFEEDSY